MTILKEWLADRGVFDDVSYGATELEIVSLNKKLINELKELPSWKDMYDFVAKHGLSNERNRLSEDKNISKDIPAIWLIPDFAENKSVIVDDICILSDISEILADKLKAEQDEEKEKADMVLDGDGDMPLTEDMGKIEADMNAHNNIQ
jgi:hypothetical protein